MADLKQIEPLLAEKIASLGFELFEMKFFRAGARSVLRIFIDKPGGITISDCEKVSHEISVFLDVEDFSNTPYSLEVSSPGLDRPLISEKDFRRVVGKHVRIRLNQGLEKEKNVTGILTACIDNAITIATTKGERIIPLSAIASGTVEISFN
jgi:ribosome maturation factor RimP